MNSVIVALSKWKLHGRQEISGALSHKPGTQCVEFESVVLAKLLESRSLTAPGSGAKSRAGSSPESVATNRSSRRIAGVSGVYSSVMHGDCTTVPSMVTKATDFWCLEYVQRARGSMGMVGGNSSAQANVLCLHEFRTIGRLSRAQRLTVLI